MRYRNNNSGRYTALPVVPEAVCQTTIKPAVREALNEIKKSKAQLKHIVLLTDGQGETENFEDIIKDCKDADVTLSTVAVGESSDRQLLERLATQ